MTKIEDYHQYSAFCLRHVVVTITLKGNTCILKSMQRMIAVNGVEIVAKCPAKLNVL